MEQISTKCILDRNLFRAEKGFTKEYLEIHEELSNKYYCNTPTIKDLYLEFKKLGGGVLELNPKAYLKLNSMLEIMINLENNKKK